MRQTVINIVISFAALLFLHSCTEPYAPGTENFENMLVVEATITNELKAQKIKLTRTYRFEDLQTTPETGAEVIVSDNAGNQYEFEYHSIDSTYYSTSDFQAMPGKEYSLSIITSNGNTYVSDQESLPTTNQVEISLEKKEVDGVYGVQIKANSYDPTNSSHFYRYEYSETFKVIPEYWSPKEAYIDDDFVVQNRLRENPQATRVCYSTNRSKEIKLSNTTDLAEDRVSDFDIRFINEDNYMLRYKYSILVTQYVENLDAYNFYESLQKAGGYGESTMSPSQPGFIAGNLSDVNNPEKKVMGYFNVASVSSQRIFLQHNVLFPEYPDPLYFEDCEVVKLDKTDWAVGGPQEGKRLYNMIEQGTMLFYKEDPLNIYWMVPPVCSDCTTFASNEIPDFWE